MTAMASPLARQVVFVTGASSGIGAAAAEELHRRGARLALFDRDATGLDALSTRLGGTALTACGDVTRSDDLEAAVAAASARFGGIDIVWANAGIASFGPLLDTDPQAWVQTIEVNLVGAFRTVRAALPSVIARRGHVAVSASAASFAHPPAMSAYSATKAGVEAMLDALGIELAHHGVTVGCIHPNWVATPMVEGADASSAAFRALRGAMRPPLGATLPVDAAALAIARALEQRDRRCFVPGWVRWVHLLRALLHTRPAERDLRRAAPEIERLFRADVASRGAAAASRGPG
jgi:NAD(P)-dependent dehydrogenase (short-subunit alcohol dehydrogenase family)